MSDPYHDPDAFDLEILATHDFSDASYCFDYRVIWKHKLTHRLYTARDSGCSCPSPFEDFNHLSNLEDFSETYLVNEAREEGAHEYYNGDKIETWIARIHEIESKYGRRFSYTLGSEQNS